MPNVCIHIHGTCIYMYMHVEHLSLSLLYLSSASGVVMATSIGLNRELTTLHCTCFSGRRYTYTLYKTVYIVYENTSVHIMSF